MHGFFLAGPTATGKTSVAHYLAEAHGYEILSADSMLIYRGMDIGTAKPTAKERKRVAYHGIDLAEVGQSFNSWQYRAYAVAALEDALHRGKDVVVVGGTGLYLKLLIHGLGEAPGPNPEVRQHWEAVLAERGVEPLQAALQEQSPSLYAAIDDPENGRRLGRVLEWAAAGLETPPRNWTVRDASAPIPALHVAPDRLKSMIEHRVRAMYRQGLLDEVRRLLSGPGGLSQTARQAIGYAEAIALLEGRCTREEAIEQTAARTRRLAKRQRSWLRTQMKVAWIDVEGERWVEDAAAAVRAHWARYGPTEVAT